MKIIAINGGPRKKWNTATMLNSFIEGAEAMGKDVQTKTYHLFDYEYQGCISCFACKKKGKKYGKCAVKDDITKLLEKASEADGIVIGSPIYFHDTTAQLRGFLERFIYQYLSFDQTEIDGTLAPKKIHTAMIYTMNVTEKHMQKSGYRNNLQTMENYIAQILGVDPVLLYAFNTYQYKDYSKYVASYWDEAAKAVHRRTQFPLDCKAAYDAGMNMVNKIRDDKR